MNIAFETSGNFCSAGQNYEWSALWDFFFSNAGQPGHRPLSGVLVQSDDSKMLSSLVTNFWKNLYKNKSRPLQCLLLHSFLLSFTYTKKYKKRRGVSHKVESENVSRKLLVIAFVIHIIIRWLFVLSFHITLNFRFCDLEVLAREY